MRRIFFLGLILSISLSACKKIDRVKNYLHRDAKKVDSVFSMAVDSISQQVRTDTVIDEKEKSVEITQAQEQDLFQGAYSVFNEAINKKDLFLIRQFCYFHDSVFVISVQGIFQVLSLEPIEAVWDNINVVNDSAFNCKLDFSNYPDLSQMDNPPKGCYARKITDFYKFSALIDLAKEANLPISPDIIKKAKEIEHKIDYAVLNTYLGWTFYFIKENGKFYLAAIDYNQY